MEKDEMARYCHQLNGCEFEQTPEDSEGQGSLVCCSPWGLLRIRHNLVAEKQQRGTNPSLIKIHV